jgi:hypothetical protein
LSLHQSKYFEVLSKCDAPKVLSGSAPSPSRTSPPASSLLSRDAAIHFVTELDQFIVRTESHSFLNAGNFRCPELDVSSRLHDRIGDETGSATLWVSSMAVHQHDLSSSRAAALNILVAAWRAGMPIISHFCERPRFALLAKERDVEKVGLIGLAYGLIARLLQFGFQEDTFTASRNKLEGLDGSNQIKAGHKL